MTCRRWAAAALTSISLAASPAIADGIVGTTLPDGFPTIVDASLGKPVIGFGAAGPVARRPVIFVHGNNDTPFATACNPYGRVQAMAQFFADQGYATSELWGLGYQGDQCDLPADQTLRSGTAHTAAANVPDLAAFVAAVRAFTGAGRVDFVGHSLGVVVVREWVRQDPRRLRQVGRIVAIDGPNHGIINCSPDPANYWQAPGSGGFTPSSAICQELGSPNTPFLKRLNQFEGLASVRTLVIRNADASFVYFPVTDGTIPPVPAIDSFGVPTDFSRSASLKHARELSLTGQGAFDPFLATGHLGILNSPATWQAAYDFLSAARP